MDKAVHYFFAVAASLATAAALAAPPSVDPEQADMGTEISAKIGKEKSKAKKSSTSSSSSDSGSGSSSSGCGTVNINSNEKKSNSGIKDMFGKQTTTIVTGPVINMASCK